MNNDCPKIILFIGSGSSAFAGYRTFETFPALIFNEQIRIEDKLPPLHPTTFGFLKEIEQTLLLSHKSTTHDNFLWALNDYKKLWYTLRVDGVLKSRFLSSTERWGEFSQFSVITEDAIRDITHTTIHHYSAKKLERIKNDIEKYELFRNIFKFYEKLSLINNSDFPILHIFTTNYDMLLEDLFLEFNNKEPDISLINGIPNCCQEGSYWSESKYPASNNNKKGFFLYRLHGCVSWFYHGQGDERVYFHRRDCTQQEINNLCAMYPGLERYRGLNPHAFGFRQFYKYLLYCNVIIFIGFSFRDDDVKHILLSANSRRDKPIKIIVIDPALQDTDIHANFLESAKNTQFPVETPSINEIKSINAHFAPYDFCDRLFKILNEMEVANE